MRWLEHKIPPPVVGLVIGALMWWAAPLGPALPLDATVRRVIVGLLVVVGLAFDVAGLASFRARRTTINPLRPERASTLVTGGVYRVTRNPMYVGMALLLLAWAVHLGAWPMLLGPVAYVLYITRLQILPEERVLERAFGDDYARYRQRVRRWL